MPWIFARIAVFLAQITAPLVARVLGALGMGIFTLVGVQSGINTLLNSVRSNFGGVAGDIASLISLSGFNVYISLVVSAYVGIITLSALFGAFRRFGFAMSAGGG